MEKASRSLIKTVSWRIWATGITAVVTYLITGSLEFAATVGVADTLVKFGAYYFHERVWNRVDYGRAEDFQI